MDFIDLNLEHLAILLNLTLAIDCYFLKNAIGISYIINVAKLF